MLDRAPIAPVMPSPAQIAQAAEDTLHHLSCEPDFTSHPAFAPAMATLETYAPARAAVMRDWLEL